MSTDEGREYQRSLVRAINAELGALGWSRSRLARESGLNPQQLDRIFNLRRDLNVTQLDRIIRALGVTPDYLTAQARRWDQRATTPVGRPVTRLTRAELLGLLASPSSDETLQTRLGNVGLGSGDHGKDLEALRTAIQQLRRDELLALLGDLAADERPHNHRNGA